MTLNKEQRRAAIENLRDVIWERGAYEFRANGNSMKPWIKPGATLKIQALNTEPQPGMIVAFDIDSRIFIHRVVRISDAGVITKGDNLPFMDGLLKSSDIIGLVSHPFTPGFNSAIAGISCLTANVNLSLNIMFSKLTIGSGYLVPPFIYDKIKSGYCALFTKISCIFQNTLRLIFLVSKSYRSH